MHAIVHAINARLDNIGKTVLLSEPLLDETDQLGSLRSLVEAMHADGLRIFESMRASVDDRVAV